MTCLAAIGSLTLSSCGSDDGAAPPDDDATAPLTHDGTAPLTTEEIQSVLLSYSDLPGAVQDVREHFGSGLFDVDDDEYWIGPTETFGTTECTQAMEDVGGVDGENQPQASGQRRAELEFDDMAEHDTNPVVRVSITSYEDETSVEQYWDDIQSACEEEVLEHEGDDWDQTVRLEPAETGEFRGLREHWAWDSPDEETVSFTHHSLSYAHGHHVIRIASDLDEETLAGLLEQQLEQLREGPQQPQEAAEMLGGADIPGAPLTSEQLADVMAEAEDFPFTASEMEVDHGPDALEQDYGLWTLAVMAVTAPAVHDEEALSPECLLFREDGDFNDLLTGQTGDGVALSLAQESGFADAGLPHGAAVLLQSHAEELDPSAAAARWGSFLDACAGQYELEHGARTLSGLDIPGIHGFTASAEIPQETDGPGTEVYSARFAHLESGHNSVRIAGLGITETQMQELIATQIEKLQDAEQPG